MRKTLAILTIVSAATAVVHAEGGQLRQADPAKQVASIRIGQLGPDGMPVEWLDFGTRQRGELELAFDCASDECGGWIFDPPYCNLYVTNDMRFDRWYGGLYVRWLTLSWFNSVAENSAIVVELFEGFDDTCACGDDCLGDSLGAVGLDFQYLPEGVYQTYVDLRKVDWLMLPADGAGAYSIWFATYKDENPEDWFPASGAQPILLACEPPQSPIQWDDDNPPDWMHQVPDECDDYTFTYEKCPTKLLQAAFSALVDANDVQCVGDLNGDNRTEHADLGILLADWGCDDPANGCAGDLNGDDKTDQADLGILLGDWGCGAP